MHQQRGCLLQGSYTATVACTSIQVMTSKKKTFGEQRARLDHSCPRHASTRPQPQTHDVLKLFQGRRQLFPAQPPDFSGFWGEGKSHWLDTSLEQGVSLSPAQPRHPIHSDFSPFYSGCSPSKERNGNTTVHQQETPKTPTFSPLVSCLHIPPLFHGRTPATTTCKGETCPSPTQYTVGAAPSPTGWTCVVQPRAASFGQRAGPAGLQGGQAGSQEIAEIGLGQTRANET